jgi:hypothetical protein
MAPRGRSKAGAWHDVDDGNDALVGHARRADDANRADDAAIDLVGGGDDAAFVERRQSRFTADEHLHALGAVAHVEQLHQTRALLEEGEQFAQAAHVGGNVLYRQQVHLAGNDVLRRGVRDGLVAGFHGGRHQLGHVGAQLAQFIVHAVADLAEIQPGEVLV